MIINPAVAAQRSFERLSRASRQQVLLRGVAGLAAAQLPLLVVLAGGVFHPLLTLALMGLVALVLLLPDSDAPTLLVLAFGGLWAISMPATMSVWTLLAAVDLLVLHLACTLASYGPPQLVLERAILVLWAGRGSLLLAVTALVWLAARLLGALDAEPSRLLTAAAFSLLLGWVAFLFARLVTRDAA
jgi:hypothetical protein